MPDERYNAIMQYVGKLERVIGTQNNELAKLKNDVVKQAAFTKFYRETLDEVAPNWADEPETEIPVEKE